MKLSRFENFLLSTSVAIEELKIPLKHNPRVKAFIALTNESFSFDEIFNRRHAQRKILLNLIANLLYFQNNHHVCVMALLLKNGERMLA